MEATLSAAPTTPRSLVTDAAVGLGLNGPRTFDTIDRLFGGSQKNPVGGFDLTGADMPLSAYRSGSEFGRGNTGGGLLEALGAIPFGIGAGTKKAASPLLKFFQKQEAQKQLTSTVPKSLGKSFQTYQFRDGDTPVFGLVDRYDNSLMEVLTGGRRGNDLGVTVSSVTAPGDTQRIQSAIQAGGLTPKQARDAQFSPRFDGPFGSKLLKALEKQGIIPGSTLASGGYGANRQAVMDSAMSLAQSKDVRNLTGNITGGRVSGAKAYSNDSTQNISIPPLLARAQKRNISPPTDLTLEGVNIPELTKDDLLPDYQYVDSMAHRDLGNRRSQQYHLDEDDFNTIPVPSIPSTGFGDTFDFFRYTRRADPESLARVVDFNDLRRLPINASLLEDMTNNYNYMRRFRPETPLTLENIIQETLDSEIPF